MQSYTYQHSIHSLKAVEGKYPNRSTAEPGSLSVRVMLGGNQTVLIPL